MLSDPRTANQQVHGLQGWLHCILYVLFENAMGIVKLGAVIAGQPLSVTPPAELELTQAAPPWSAHAGQ